MSSVDPNQLSLDIGTSQVDPGEVIDQILRNELARPTASDIDSDLEREVDRLVQTGQFTYAEAFARVGTSQDQLLPSSPEAKKPARKRGRQPIATLLAERATLLMGAAYHYRTAAKSDAAMHDLASKGADGSKIDEAMIDEQTHRYAGDADMSKLNRVKDLEKAGLSSIQVRSGARDAVESFRDLSTSTDPKKQDELLALLGVLKAQHRRS